MDNTTLDTEILANLYTDNLDVALNILTSGQAVNKFQLIYASQLYGTFFCVFAKLTISDNKLVSMQLKLINYKGHTNLGLLPETNEAWKPTQKGDWKLVLHISGSKGKHMYNEGQEILVDCKETPLGQLETFFVGRELYEMYPKSDVIDQLKKGNFDSEFYSRDGSFIIKKPSMDEFYKQYRDVVGFAQAGDVCNTTKINLV